MRSLDEHLRQQLPPIGAWLSTPLRLAAVVCPIVSHRGADHVLLLARPTSLRQHAGQLAFPGGMREGDESIETTARRECREEISIADTDLDLLGGLPARESSSGILVHAVVARLRPVELRPDRTEVARVLHAPLHELQQDERWHDRPPPGGATGRQPRTSPHFQLGDDLLWGLTARFVRELVSLLPSPAR